MIVITQKICRLSLRWVRLVVLACLSCQLVLMSGLSSTGFAAVDARETVQKGTVEFGFLTGFWQATDVINAGGNARTNRNAVFILPQWGVVLTDELEASWFSGNVEVFVEPMAAHFFQPFSASAFGGTLNLKYNFLSFGRWMPFWDGGAGALWTDLAPRIPEQDTQFNFILQTGPGVHYFLTDQLTLTSGVRFSHISNSDIGDRNTGLNAWLFNFGFSFFVP